MTRLPLCPANAFLSKLAKFVFYTSAYVATHTTSYASLTWPTSSGFETRRSGEPQPCQADRPSGELCAWTVSRAAPQYCSWHLAAANSAATASRASDEHKMIAWFTGH